MEIKDLLYIAGAVVLGNFIYDKVKDKLDAISGLSVTAKDLPGESKVQNIDSLGGTVSDPRNQFPVKMGQFGPEYVTN